MSSSGVGARGGVLVAVREGTVVAGLERTVVAAREETFVVVGPWVKKGSSSWATDGCAD